MKRPDFKNIDRRYLAVGTVLLGLFLLSFVILKMRSPDAQVAGAAVSSFDIKVNAVGALDAAQSNMINSPLRGDRGKIISLISDGTRVQAGEILVRLDPSPFEEEVLRLTGEMRSRESAVRALEQVLEWEKSELERQIETTEYNLRIAQLELEKVKNGEGPLQLAQLRSETDKAKQELSRYSSYLHDLEELEKKGYRNPMEISQAREKVAQFGEAYGVAQEKYNSYKDYVFPTLTETALAKIGKAKMEKEQTRKEGVFKVAKAVAELDKSRREFETARARLDQSQEELNKTVIRAPMPGIAILSESFYGNQKRKPRVGDAVLQGQPLVYLPDVSSMVVKTEVREVDIHKIAAGQHATVHVDAYPDLVFSGTVNSVGVLAAERPESGKGEKYLQVTVAIQGEDPRLRPGMTARVSIMVDAVKDVLSVPLAAVYSEEGGKYCFVASGAGFRKAGVTVGRQNEDLAEILSGLKAGEQVSLIKPSPDIVK